MERDHKPIKELQAYAVTGTDLILLEVLKEMREIKEELKIAKEIAGHGACKCDPNPPAKKKVVRKRTQKKS